MGLKDLRSNLSNFRSPFTGPKSPIDKRIRPEDKDNPSQTPLTDNKLVNLPNNTNTSPAGRHEEGSTNIQNLSPLSGRHTHGIQIKESSLTSGRHETGIDVKNTTSPTGNIENPNTVILTKSPIGRHEVGKEVSNKVEITGRHNKGADILNESAIAGRHIKGVDVTNKSLIVGHHTKGVDVHNESALSGRFTEGEDVTNTSAISGRFTEGEDVNNSSAISGRHETGKDVTNSSAISGRHTIGEDVTNTSAISGRFTEGKEVSNGSEISGRFTEGEDVTNTSAISGRHTNGAVIDDSNYSDKVGEGLHKSPDHPNHSTLDFDNTKSKYIDLVSSYGIHGKPVPVNHSGLDKDSIPDRYQVNVNSGQFNPAVANKSILDIDKTPSKYSVANISNFLNDASINSALRWQGAVSPATNVFSDKQGARGFTIKQTQTDFLGIDGTTYEYPNLLYGGRRLMEVGGKKYEAQLAPGSPGFNNLGFSNKNKYIDTAGKIGLLGPRAVKRNSPSWLDDEYTKFNLQDDSWNPTYIKHPLILRGIQRKDNPETQRWGFINKSLSFDDGLIRGGVLASTERAAVDGIRISKFLASPKGLIWIVKQAGLGLTNPKWEQSPLSPLPLQQTRIHTGIASLASVLTSHTGIHFTRHGIPFANEISSYGNIQKAKLIAQNAGDIGSIDPLTGNRLIRLRNELGIKRALEVVGGNRNKVLDSLTQGINTLLSVASFIPGVSPLASQAQNIANSLLKSDIPIGTPIPSLSLNIGGPQSVYGLGPTNIRRWVNTIPEGSSDSLQYSIKKQYASALSISNTKTLDDAKVGLYNDRSGDTIPVEQSIDALGIAYIHEANAKNETTVYPFAPEGDNNTGTHKPGGPALPSVNTGNPLTSYSTLAYGSLKREKKTLDQNFKGANSLNGKAIEAEDLSDYSKTNRDTTYGMGKQGVPDNLNEGIRSDYTDSAVKLDDKGKIESVDFNKFRGDKVNLIDAKIGANKSTYADIYRIVPDGETTKDFIKFFITGPKQIGTKTNSNASEEVLVFRATVTGFQDSFKPSWQDVKIMGRADNTYIYDSWERNINFDFTVAATSRDELRSMWRKLNYLASWTAPKYGGDTGTIAPMLRLTLGNLFQETPMFIDSLSYSINDESAWEINLENDDKLMQVPLVVDVSISFTVLHDFRPQWNGRMYSLSNRGRSNTEHNWLWDSSIPGSGTSGKKQQETNTKKNTDDAKAKQGGTGT